jgi:hypothetical protein
MFLDAYQVHLSAQSYEQETHISDQKGDVGGRYYTTTWFIQATTSSTARAQLHTCRRIDTATNQFDRRLTSLLMNSISIFPASKFQALFVEVQTMVNTRRTAQSGPIPRVS